jgi:acetyl esterase/lipase
MLRFLIVCAWIPLSLSPISAAEQRIDLWPAGHAGGPPASIPEKVVHAVGWTYVTDIQVPGIIVHRPSVASAGETGVIICPGGGYRGLAFEHEGNDLADWLNQRGVTAFVLYYRHAPDKHPAPLQDVLRAIRIVRSRAAEFGVRSDRIGVIGFSAGGHLASCAATLYDSAEGRGGDTLDATSAKPDFAALIYAVISMKGPFVQGDSRDNLLGPKATEAKLEQLSTDTQVTSETPPLFLVQAGDDKAVSADHSLRMYAAALKAGVPVELHVFEQGGHGFGMRRNAGEAAIWPDLFLGWLRQRAFVTSHQ